MSNKILFVAPYRDGSGYAKSALEVIQSLDKVGVDVVCRSIKLNNNKEPIPDRIRELENKSALGCDTSIIYCLPHFFSRDGNYKKQIGVYCYETSHFRPSGWQHYLNNCVDQIVVPSSFMVKQARDSGVETPIEVIPFPIDTDKFDKSYPKLTTLERDISPNALKFYTISSFLNRKNLGAIFHAYQIAFQNLPKDEIELIVKLDTGKSPEEIFNLTQNIKRSLKFYTDEKNYKEERIVVQRMSDEEIYSLHQLGDIFITASHGESYCLPCMDALGFGNAVIAPRHSCFTDYIDDKVGYLVDSEEGPIYGEVEHLPNLYTAYEDWWSPKLGTMIEQMKCAYNDFRIKSKSTAATIQKQCKQRVYSNRREIIGEQWLKLLE